MRFIYTAIIIVAVTVSQSSCLIPAPLQQSQKDAITADTNCLDRYALVPIWLAQCNSIKGDRVTARDQETKAKKEKDLKESSDNNIVRAHANDWDSFIDVAAYPPSGTYPCKVDTLKSFSGGSISYGASTAQECDAWISKSHELGRNMPQIIKDHPDLIPIFLQQDQMKAFEICKREGIKRGYVIEDIGLSSLPYKNNALQAGDGRYHCDISTPKGTRTFYSFTQVDGSMSENELAENKADNLNVLRRPSNTPRTSLLWQR